MLPNRVSNPGPLTYESGALPIALRGPAGRSRNTMIEKELSIQISIESVKIKSLFLIDGTLVLQCGT